MIRFIKDMVRAYRQVQVDRVLRHAPIQPGTEAVTVVLISELAKDDALRKRIRNAVPGGPQAAPAVRGWVMAAIDRKDCAALREAVLSETLRRVEWDKVADSLGDGPKWADLRDAMDDK